MLAYQRVYGIIPIYPISWLPWNHRATGRRGTRSVTGREELSKRATWIWMIFGC